MRTAIAVLAALLIAPPTASAASTSIPYFARQYGVSCAQCHVGPPKLNAFGEEFVARGYEMPRLEARRTWPFALWISGRSDSRLDGATARDVNAYLNRVELISGGKVVAPWLSYFVEWRIISNEGRPDGTLRDRSGRFEDLFLTAAWNRGELTVGQFRQIAQVDVSRRLGLSEPLALSAGLPGFGSGDQRDISLRGFAPAGRSPSARLAWSPASTRDSASWRWVTSVAVPIPGELSVPLTEDARTEARNDVEWRSKGVVLESFARRGLQTVGGHVFFDDRRRYLAQAVATGQRSALHWAAVAGAVKHGDFLAGRWSVEAELLPSSFYGGGVRAEDRAADGAGVAIVPYLNAHFPGLERTLRLTVEGRIQRNRGGASAELAAIF